MILKILLFLIVITLLYLVWSVKRLKNETFTLFTVTLEQSLVLKKLNNDRTDILNEEGEFNVASKD